MNTTTNHSGRTPARAQWQRSPVLRLTYVVVAMIALIAVASIGVDWGHVESVKTDMQRYARRHRARVRRVVPSVRPEHRQRVQALGSYSSAENPVDSNFPASRPTVTVQWGSWWNTTAKSFSTVRTVAPTVKVAIRPKRPPTAMPSRSPGRRCSGTVPATCRSPRSAAVMGRPEQRCSPRLGNGRPLSCRHASQGSTVASWDDTTSNAPPYQITSVPVIPGTYITLTNVAGQVRHDPTLAYDGADGNSGFILQHGSDSPGGPTPAAENGVAGAIMPIDALVGLFLTDAAPNSSPAPASLDYTDAASRNQAQYNSIELFKQAVLHRQRDHDLRRDPAVPRCQSPTQPGCSLVHLGRLPVEQQRRFLHRHHYRRGKRCSWFNDAGGT